MEEEKKYVDKTENKTIKILNEEYFLVDVHNNNILTKIQYTQKWMNCLSFVNGVRVYNYVGQSDIENNWQVINKEQFEQTLNDSENIMKSINNIKNELDYMISFEKTEKMFLSLLDVRKKLDKEKILKALDMAKKLHNWQLRDEWTVYIIHPITVAIYAMKDGLDTDSIIACLLHDVLEDNKDSSESDIKELFWNDAVDIIKKLSKKIWNQKKDINKYYEEIMSDKIALKLKWFDRLNNVYSLFLNPDSNKVIDYIKKTETEILPIIRWTDTANNIENIIKILKSNEEIREIYKKKLENQKNIQKDIQDKKHML